MVRPYMNVYYQLLSISLMLFVLSPSANSASEQKRVALTYDDAPMSDSFLSGTERTAKLIDGLRRAEVTQAAFFVTTQGINSPQQLKRIQAYAAAGHIIANHSHTHPWLRNISAEAYVADIDRAEETLALFENRRPWFRYPFLNEAPDIEKRNAVRKALKNRGLQNGYVTIDTFDWYLNSLYQETLKTGGDVCLPALSKLYVEMMVGAANFNDEVARETLGRSPAHTLLLHENDLAALFVVDLVKSLKADGWKIVTADEAYADPIAGIEPDTQFLGAGRVAALAYLAGRNPNSLEHFATDEDRIKQAYESKNGVKGKCKP